MRYLFEDYVLDDARHELRRGTEIVAVEARIFDLLTYLIRNRDRVVGHEDLRMAIWDGRIVSASTLSSCMNAVRTAIGDNGEDQRLIRTLPRKGFRFVGSVVEDEKAAALAVSSIAPAPALRAALDADSPAPAEPTGSPSEILPVAQVQHPGRSIKLADASFNHPVAVTIAPAGTGHRAAIFAAGAGAGALAAALAILLWPLSGAPRNASGAHPTKTFDASVVPLVSDEARRGFANFHARPDFKALALSGNGQWHVVDGAQDLESAKQGALQGCAEKAKRACTIYAAGTDVVWSNESVPLPAPGDLRTQALDAPLVIGEIPAVGAFVQHQVSEVYPKALLHKALAITTLGYGWVGSLNTRGEAARVSLERCAYRYQRPCLTLAVDNFLTIEVPKSRNIARIFLPSWELEMSDADKERVGRIYQGRAWRAVARGTKGGWHAVANEPSEEAAIDAVLKSCKQDSEDCRLYAIGNFAVAED